MLVNVVATAEGGAFDLPFFDDFYTWEESSSERETKHHQTKVCSFISHAVGSLSLLASIVRICIILRSRNHGLSTTLHRLLFGLCIVDILSSTAHALSSIMPPQELDYVVWNAASCGASSGFILLWGTMSSSLLYTASLCLHYLAIVSYHKKEDYIRSKIEPWMYGYSIL